MLALAFASVLVCPTEAVAATRRDLPQIFTGQAFDTCSAPSPALLRAWRHSSPYGAVGLYIGGENRACSQRLLNRIYVHAAARMGWRLLPLYVGAQAPCVTRAHARMVHINPSNAISQGQSDGRDAIRVAHSLGLAPGSPVYLDMEAYRRDHGTCTAAVLRYATAWSRVVHQSGYLSGFYGSAASGIADLASFAARGQGRTARQVRSMPDAVWYARWDNRPSTECRRTLGKSQWAEHRRIHQYLGNSTENHGGQRATIDRSAVDAPVAVVR